MSRTLELTIPAPCDWINANQRLHWAEKARRTKAWRTAAHYIAGAVPRRQRIFTTPVHIVCTVHKTRNGRFDVSNLAPTSKALVDGLVDAGVIPDDSNQWVTGPDMRAGEKRTTPAVHVLITEIQP